MDERTNQSNNQAHDAARGSELADAGRVADAARNVGAFHVNVANRKGLGRGTERALRVLAGSGAAVEVEAEPHGAAKWAANEEKLAKELRKLLKDEVFTSKDVRKGVPARCLRIPRDSPFMHPNPTVHGSFLAGGDRDHRSLKRRLLLLQHGDRNRTADAAKSGTLPAEEAVHVDRRTGRALDHAQQLFRYLVLCGLDQKRQREQWQVRKQQEGSTASNNGGGQSAAQAAAEGAGGGSSPAKAEAAERGDDDDAVDVNTLVVNVRVEVKLRSWGKWYPAVIDSVTLSSLRSGQGYGDDELDARDDDDDDDDDYMGSDDEQAPKAAGGKENAAAAAKQEATKKQTSGPNSTLKKKAGKKKAGKKKKKKGAPSTAAKATAALFEEEAKPPPAAYNVRLLKSSRPGRLEEAVEEVLRKCSKPGEVVEVDEETVRPPRNRIYVESCSLSLSLSLSPSCLSSCPLLLFFP